MRFTRKPWISSAFVAALLAGAGCGGEDLLGAGRSGLTILPEASGTYALVIDSTVSVPSTEEGKPASTYRTRAVGLATIVDGEPVIEEEALDPDAPLDFDAIGEAEEAKLHQGRPVTVRMQLCQAVLPKVQGYQPQIANESLEMIEPVEMAAWLRPAEEAGRYVIEGERSAIQIGVVLDDPFDLEEALPTEEDDARVVDADADGQAGVTIVVPAALGMKAKLFGALVLRFPSFFGDVEFSERDDGSLQVDRLSGALPVHLALSALRLQLPLGLKVITKEKINESAGLIAQAAQAEDAIHSAEFLRIEDGADCAAIRDGGFLPE